MSDSVNLQFVLTRLDRIQTELSMMRLRDERIAATLSRQMVEMTMALEQRVGSIGTRLIALETRFDDQLDTIVNQLADIGQRLDALQGGDL